MVRNRNRANLPVIDRDIRIALACSSNAKVAASAGLAPASSRSAGGGRQLCAAQVTPSRRAWAAQSGALAALLCIRGVVRRKPFRPFPDYALRSVSRARSVVSESHPRTFSGASVATFSIVRFRIKPGREAAFLDAHRHGRAKWPGLVNGHIIATGERSYCLVCEWDDNDALVAARSRMIATLDTFRDTLEDVGDGRGVTDAVSGDSVLDLNG